MQETKGHTKHILDENKYNRKIKEILSTQTKLNINDLI